MTDLGETLDSAALAHQHIGAIDELRARETWLCWKSVTRPGQTKPTKIPINPHNGLPGSSTEPRTWGTWQEACAAKEKHKLAGVGYVITADDGYTGIDLDGCRDPVTGDIEPWAYEILSFGETYAEVSPSKTGIRIFARGKAIQKSILSRPAHVEIYVNERYLTVTGEHIDGTPDEIRPAPRTIQVLLARKEALDPDRKLPTSTAPVTLGAPTTDRERAWAEIALTETARELAQTGSGGRNHALNAAAFRLGRIVARGWLKQTDVVAALEDACKTNGVWKEDGPRTCRGSILSGLKSGLSQPHEDLEDRPHDIEAERMGEQIAAALEAQEQPDPEPDQPVEYQESEYVFPDHLTRIDGLMGEMVDWISSTAKQPSRVASLAAAIGVMSAVCGRAYCGPTKSGVVFYAALLGKTGSGKDHCISMAEQILRDCELGELVGPGRFTSTNALEAHLKDTAISCCPIDEVGDVIAKFNNPRAGEHMKGMSDTLMSLWGKNLKWFTTTRYASVKQVSIKTPSLSILGVSTPDRFWPAFHGSDIASGFLNRFIVLNMEDQEPVYERKGDSEEAETPTPESIKRKVRALRGGGCDDMAFAVAFIPGTSTTFQTIKMTWETPEVEDIHLDHLRAIHKIRRSSPRLDPFYGRTAEIALRLAQIYALGCGKMCVGASEMQWGVDVANHSAKSMIHGARLYMASSDFDAKMNHALRIIEKRNGTCTRQHLAAGLRVRPKELTEILESLLEAGQIAKDERQGRTDGRGGKKTVTFRLGPNVE